MQNENGVVVAGLAKIADVKARLIQFVDTLSNYARRGCEGLYALHVPDIRFGTAGVVGIAGTTFTIVFFLTVWVEGHLGILLGQVGDLFSRQPAPRAEDLLKKIIRVIGGGLGCW